MMIVETGFGIFYPSASVQRKTKHMFHEDGELNSQHRNSPVLQRYIRKAGAYAQAAWVEGKSAPFTGPISDMRLILARRLHEGT